MQTIKKVLSGAASVLMAGATLMAPAFAAGISDTFDSMNPGNTVVVVGADANVADVVSAINVGAALGQHGATATSTGATTTTSGVKQDDFDLGTTLSTWSALKDTHVAGLLDTKVNWDGEDVDVEEIVDVSGVDILTSEDDEDFGSNVFLGTDASSGSMKYTFKIKDNDFNASAVSADKPLDITFLGRSLSITEITDGTPDDDSIKVTEGIEQAMREGDSVTINGKTVTINAIGETAVSVTVDGVTEFVSVDTATTTYQEEIGSSGIEVEVKNVIVNSNDPSASQALVKIGSDLAKTITNGDPMEMFGEPDDTVEAMWTWGVNVISDTEVEIMAVSNQKLDSDKEDVAPVGGSLNFPDDYVKVVLDSLTTDDYIEYTVSFEDGVKVNLWENETSVGKYTDQQTVVLRSNKNGEGFKVDVGGTIEDTDTIYLIKGSSETVGAFENSDGKIQLFSEDTNNPESFNISYGDTTIPVTYTNVSTQLNITLTGIDVAGTGTAVIDADIDNQQLGDNKEDSDSDELKILGNSKGTSEDDFMTDYGVIFVTPDDHGANDEVVIRVPAEKVQATVIVEGPGSEVSTTEGTADITFQEVDNIAKLDTQATADKTTKNLILVGGPAVNDFVAELAAADKTPDVDYWRSNLQGKGIIQVIEDAFAEGNAALIVAGYDKEDTSNAASQLVAGGLSDSAVLVQGTTVSAFDFSGNTEEETA